MKISEIENENTIDHDHDKYITAQKFNKLNQKSKLQDYEKQI